MVSHEVVCRGASTTLSYINSDCLYEVCVRSSKSSGVVFASLSEYADDFEVIGSGVSVMSNDLRMSCDSVICVVMVPGSDLCARGKVDCLRCIAVTPGGLSGDPGESVTVVGVDAAAMGEVGHYAV